MGSQEPEELSPYMAAFQKDGSFLRKMVLSYETGKRLFSNYKESHIFERNSEGENRERELFLLLLLREWNLFFLICIYAYILQLLSINNSKILRLDFIQGPHFILMNEYLWGVGI